MKKRRIECSVREEAATASLNLGGALDVNVGLEEASHETHSTY